MHIPLLSDSPLLFAFPEDYHQKVLFVQEATLLYNL